MGEIKLADFGTGIDTRRSASTSNPKSFRDIENCFITTGHTLKKRGGFKHIARLPANTAGLMAYNGALQVFRTTTNADKLPIVLAANVAIAVNGDTTPFATVELENVGVRRTVKTLVTNAGIEQVANNDIRYVHFADDFNAAPYIIIEYWDGRKSHHYVDELPVFERVPVFTALTSLSSNMIRPSQSSSNPAFVFLLHGTTTSSTEPYYGLKDYASRQVTLWGEKSSATYADFEITGVINPTIDPVYIALHNQLEAAIAILNTTLALPVTKDVETQTVGGVVTSRVFAENKVLQAAYVGFLSSMQAAYDATATAQAGVSSVVNRRINELWAIKESKRGALANLNARKVNKSNRTILTRERNAAATALAAATTAYNNYIALHHADGGTGLTAGSDAILLYCRWKMENYAAMKAAEVFTLAPTLAVGDEVWVDPRFGTQIVGGIASTVLLNALGIDLYCTAIDPNETRYTHIKDQDLNQDNTIAVNIAEKLFVADGDRVQFSQTNDPTRWFFDPNDTNVDAGWLPVGIHQSGERVVTALGQHLGKLTVFFSDASQVWTVDPNPDAMAFVQTIEGAGTSFKHSVGNVSNDSVFLHRTGFRAISAMQYNNNLTDADFGSPVDNPVQAHLQSAALRRDVQGLFDGAADFFTPEAANATPVVSKTIASLGQYWCAIGKDIWVFSYSRAAKVAGWSRYTLPYQVDYIAEMNGTVYIRSGVDVYAYDANKLEDDLDGFAATTAPIIGTASFQYLNAKAAGRLKMFHSFDSVVIGDVNMRFKFDARNPDIQTADVPLTGDSNPDYLTPMQVTSTSIAPVVESVVAFELEYLALYFNMLGRR